jgi:hypothetical protein
MAENQKRPTGQSNQDSKLGRSDSRGSEMREGKAQGSPSNVKGSRDTEMSKKNKEGLPDESKIQGDQELNSRRSGNDISRSNERDTSGNSRRNGGSL